MIIELQNFGPIKSFKFDTDKDIHAIFGKNNIGKSYAISAVYLILKGLKEFKIETQDYHLFNAERTLMMEPSEDNSVFKNYDSGVINYLNETLVKDLNKSFRNTFDKRAYRNYFADKVSTIKIILEDHSIDIEYSDGFSEFKVVSAEFGSYVKIIKENGVNKIQIFNKKSVLLKSSDVVYANIDFFVDRINTEMSPIFYLPASRSGLYNSLNSFGSIFAEISKYRLATNAKFEIPNLSEPISDYFLNLNNIENTIVSDNYINNFELLERKILKGTVVFDYHSKKYFYTPDNTFFHLELSFTSSMISEIAPIIAHLKYIIPLQNETPSILFIEEPEAHLHPEIQILLLEYFVKLSKGNLKIVMTSHSNYIFNKLSNMVISKEISPDRLSVSLMKMTPEGSVVEEGAMHMDEYGIEDDNFVDVAEQLYEERIKLLEKL
jgi:predicted ATPase